MAGSICKGSEHTVPIYYDDLTMYSGSEASSSLSSRSENSKNRVSFGRVKVRTHNVILGDNPSVSEGPPLSLDWNHVNSEDFELDDYESLHGDTPKKARAQMRVCGETRREMLRGHSAESFSRSSKVIDEIKASRRETKRQVKSENIASARKALQEYGESPETYARLLSKEIDGIKANREISEAISKESQRKLVALEEYQMMNVSIREPSRRRRASELTPKSPTKNSPRRQGTTGANEEVPVSPTKKGSPFGRAGPSRRPRASELTPKSPTKNSPRRRGTMGANEEVPVSPTKKGSRFLCAFGRASIAECRL